MNTVVISLGGSIVVPDEVDHTYVQQFKEMVSSMDNTRFVIIVGGGAKARRYQQDLRESNPQATHEDLDWVGIKATHENAKEVRDLFGDELAETEVIIAYDKPITWNKQVLFGAGWKPGHSTDYDAVHSAEMFKGDLVINVSTADFLYDKNPKEFSDAKKITQATWDELQAIVGHEWSPGAHVPFDPEAVKLGKKIGLKLAMVGKGIDNIKQAILGKDFEGTLVK